MKPRKRNPWKTVAELRNGHFHIVQVGPDKRVCLSYEKRLGLGPNQGRFTVKVIHQPDGNHVKTEHESEFMTITEARKQFIKLAYQ